MLSKERETSIILEFQRGDFSSVKEFVDAYIKLAKYLAYRVSVAVEPLAADGAASEAYLALVEVPLEIQAGKEVESLRSFVQKRVIGKVRNYVRHNRMIRIPFTTLHRKKLRVPSRETDFRPSSESDGMYRYNEPTLALLYSLADRHKSKEELHNWLIAQAKTDFERKIVVAVLEGCTDREIAHRLGAHERLIRQIKSEYIVRVKEQRNLPTLAEFN